ncbi:MAG: hypothetical protein WD042_01425 [Phycisphaeraceae bacterium]
MFKQLVLASALGATVMLSGCEDSTTPPPTPPTPSAANPGNQGAAGDTATYESLTAQVSKAIQDKKYDVAEKAIAELRKLNLTDQQKRTVDNLASAVRAAKAAEAPAMPAMP